MSKKMSKKELILLGFTSSTKKIQKSEKEISELESRLRELRGKVSDELFFQENLILEDGVYLIDGSTGEQMFAKLGAIVKNINHNEIRILNSLREFGWTSFLDARIRIWIRQGLIKEGE
jgi:hypothetical protein